MTLVETMRYLEQASRIPTIKLISFTGGEPFLFLYNLIHMVSHASKLGFSVECTTNCLWAKDYEVAKQRLRALKNVGLSIINLSVDDFHQEYIPFDRVKNCFEVAKKLGLRIVILCVIRKKSKLRLRNVINMLGDDDIFILEKGFDPRSLAEHKIIAIENGFIPVGHGTKIPKEEILTLEKPPVGCCEYILRDIAIDPTGKVLSCCSAACLTPPLVIGDINKKSLLEIVERANGDKLINFLATKGPYKLFEKMRRHGLMKQENRYVNKCHLCYDILSNPEIKRVFLSSTRAPALRF